MKKINVIFIFILFLVLSAFTLFYYTSLDTREPSLAPEIGGVAREATPASEEYTIIAFGDSLTAGYGLPLLSSYPKQLEKKLLASGYNVAVVNAGISGETSFGNLERAEFIRSQSPEVILLSIGGNDALRGFDIETTQKNIKKTLDILMSGEKAPFVFLLQIQAPSNGGERYKKEFDAIYERLSRETGAVLLPFVVEEVFKSEEYMLPDGIHPNEKGYEFIVNTYIYPNIVERLNKEARSEALPL